MLVPEGIAGASGRRAARLGIHGKRVARKTYGLEGVLVDNAVMGIGALDPNDSRNYQLKVAGPAALLIAKLIKLYERRDSPDRLADKDAVDILRILRAVPTAVLAGGIIHQRGDVCSKDVASTGVRYLEELFGHERGLGIAMAARGLAPLEDPETVAASAVLLSRDLLDDIGEETT